MRAIAFQWQLVAFTSFCWDEKFDFKIACVRFTGQRENGAHLFFFQRPPEREHVETGCFFSERPFRQFTTVRSWLNVLEKKMSTIRRILKWKVAPNANISDQSADYILLFATQ